MWKFGRTIPTYGLEVSYIVIFSTFQNYLLGIYCNGHVMVDAEKMSKSKGNFLMLLECVEEYSADATRFALADAGVVTHDNI